MKHAAAPFDFTSSDFKNENDQRLTGSFLPIQFVNGNNTPVEFEPIIFFDGFIWYKGFYTSGRFISMASLEASTDITHWFYSGK